MGVNHHTDIVCSARLFGPCRVFFFFSSRRRHTRSDRDWSSDVCSSDLLPIRIPPAHVHVEQGACLDTAQAQMDVGGALARMPRAAVHLADQTPAVGQVDRSEEHTSELQSRSDLVCRLLLEKKKKTSAKCTPKPSAQMPPSPPPLRKPRNERACCASSHAPKWRISCSPTG